MAEIGILCGMVREAEALGDLAHDPRVAVAISGARPDKAEAEARRLARNGCRLLVSWGIAGGLAPAYRPGEIIVPSAVMNSRGERFGLRPDLVGRKPGPVMLGLDEVVLSVRAKAALAATGAVAVDMETHRVAMVGQEHEIPVIAIRAVADPAGLALPKLAATALGEDGRPKIGSVVLGLLTRPFDLPALLTLKENTDDAITALGAEAAVLGEAVTAG